MIKRNRQPTSPGQVIKEITLPALGWTQGQAAEKLGVSRQALSNLLRDNHPARLTAEMAVKFENVFGGTAETWMAMQTAYDLYTIRHSKQTT